MTRAYLRVDPALFETKVIKQKYPIPLYAAFTAALCLAESQPERGRFRDERVLRSLLGPLARYVPELVKRKDLKALKDGRLYVVGWDEWQEGDWKVGERVRRIRARPRDDSDDDGGGETVTSTVTSTVTPNESSDSFATESIDSNPTVYTPSDGGRQSVIDGGGGRHSDSPQPPPKRGRGLGRRANGTNPRSLGTNPRAIDERQFSASAERRRSRHLAYLDGRITSGQLELMNQLDAPLTEIPAESGAAYVDVEPPPAFRELAELLVASPEREKEVAR